MKKLLGIIAITIIALAACNSSDSDYWEDYAEWREANDQWLAEQQARTNADGTPYFTTIVPEWNPSSFILIHYFNDRSETEGNLSPLFTSTVDTRYYLHLYDGTVADSSSALTTNGPGIFRTKVNSVIQGWSAALTDMRCGDTAEVIIPYALGYGSTNMDPVLPYSNLQFHMSLVDIPYYELAPYE